ncbi:MAG: undecaprenyldiphospho-muramoylpentapeptide beta-N-acetylglucosaminyltransferase [Bacteroidales bacterium]|nr:undecaprenyldiphospho-muramoylpentapeptide beta-N-acetylglucosaminyltransferase [Bacteroidales bacterium]MDD2424575.1 undecaprenyldiphospho-muramoylpentapeptide beta-N-acetylglucosaminyltransferase [Bacteroidales bacterium]MDD3988751.1 undecaprenyldiphospho-muramoylpentapeptide beta-N-acetylglucosaminyltransferase [Bacteroidales bacterium]
MNTKFKIIITGGGTGGHIFPAISIARALEKLSPGCEILFVGALGRMEMERVPAEGYKIVGLPVAGLKRSLSAENLKLPGKIAKSLRMAGTIIDNFKPDVAVGVGGYASAPLLWMASRRKIPYIIQEQNSYAGLANRILGRKAEKICVAYKGMERFFNRKKIIVTGNPVREEITKVHETDRTDAVKYFGLDPSLKVLLVVGGSLGSATLNESVKRWIAKGNTGDIQLIWQYGKGYRANIEEFMTTHRQSGVKDYEFIKRMDLAFAAADVIITRAGAGTISELCIARKACIFVPSPNVAEDHQTHNAMALVRENAAAMVPDNQAPEKVMDEAISLLNDNQRRERMIKNIWSMALYNSAETIAGEIVRLAEREPHNG